MKINSTKIKYITNQQIITQIRFMAVKLCMQHHTRPESFNQLISVFRNLIVQTVCSWLVGTKTCSHTVHTGLVLQYYSPDNTSIGGVKFHPSLPPIDSHWDGGGIGVQKSSSILHWFNNSFSNVEMLTVIKHCINIDFSTSTKYNQSDQNPTLN